MKSSELKPNAKKRKELPEKGGSKKKKKKKKSKQNTKSIEQNKQQQQLQQHDDVNNRQQNSTNKTLSLASQLKKARGTPVTTPLPPPWSNGRSSNSSSKLFLSLDVDGDDFISCQKECYKGFCWDNPEDISSDVHANFESSLHDMDESGLFMYDVVQPGGKKSTFTFVTRTLVGEPGSTYKYLGLRLFSHPWSAFDDKKIAEDEGIQIEKEVRNLIKLGYTRKCAKALIQMGRLNQILINKTKDKLEAEVKPTIKDGLVGSSEFTITLINKMEPTSVKKDLKQENIHGIGKTSVGWHKDSGVQDFSSIAVYHILQSMKDQHVMKDIPWRVALRVADPNSSSTPALSVPLPSGTCYYLLDDFNHQHEHAVIAGSDTLRYSSTHRVARDGSGTNQFIQDKSTTILSSNLISSLKEGNLKALSSYNTKPLQKKLTKEVRSCFQLMQELEFEWIRMWNIQGQHHADLHPFWHNPIETMKQTFLQLRQATNVVINALNEKGDYATFISEDLFDVVIEALESKEKLRGLWEQRLHDKIFKSLPKDNQPIACNIFNVDEPSAKEVRKWRSTFILKVDDNVESSSKGGKEQKSNKLSSMTKKEKKKVASNWQRMKSIIQKKK